LTSVEQGVRAYQDLVDAWVLDAVSRGASSFWAIVNCLPGVYPLVVREALQRLNCADLWAPERISWSHTMEQSAASLEAPCVLPPPHQLACDWRFSQATVIGLWKKLVDGSASGDTIALLGTPTVYAIAASRRDKRRVVLVDRNPRLPDFARRQRDYSVVYTRDILVDEPVSECASAVMMDPPWYEDETKAFLWAASSMCRPSGAVLLSSPPLGVRPDIGDERRRVLEWAAELGLSLDEVEPLSLSYETPLFEINALRASGFQDVPRHWRRGDLLVFRKVRAASAPRPHLRSSLDDWREFRFGVGSIWIRRRQMTQFQDPRLVSLFTNDIFPSVSRRTVGGKR